MFMVSCVWLTLKLSFITMIVLLMIGIPLAFFFSRLKIGFLKYLFESLVLLPLVLPPTVLGFYLLVTCNYITSAIGVDISFSFFSIFIGSVVYSLPFVVQPLQNAFLISNKLYYDVAITLKSSKFDYFFNTNLIFIRKSIYLAAVLCFAHTLGEFGVVLMIGGNVPGETQVISIAIYECVEKLAYTKAHLLSIFMVFISFFVLFFLSKIENSYFLLK